MATSLDGTKEDYVGVLHKHVEDQVMELWHCQLCHARISIDSMIMKIISYHNNGVVHAQKRKKYFKRKRERERERERKREREREREREKQRVGTESCNERVRERKRERK